MSETRYYVTPTALDGAHARLDVAIAHPDVSELPRTRAFFLQALYDGARQQSPLRAVISDSQRDNEPWCADHAHRFVRAIALVSRKGSVGSYVISVADARWLTHMHLGEGFESAAMDSEGLRVRLEKTGAPMVELIIEEGSVLRYEGDAARRIRRSSPAKIVAEFESLERRAFDDGYKITESNDGREHSLPALEAAVIADDEDDPLAGFAPPEPGANIALMRSLRAAAAMMSEEELAATLTLHEDFLREDRGDGFWSFVDASGLAFAVYRGSSKQQPGAFNLRRVEASLAGKDLRASSWCAAVCVAQDFHDVDLSNAMLADSDFTGTSLRGAKLVGADLSRAILANCDLRDAKLTDADLEGADLRGANLDGATLDGACLRGTHR